MSVSDKPWLAVRQPSLRGGVPQVMTRPRDARASAVSARPEGQIGVVTAMHAVTWAVCWRRHGRSVATSRRHIDLLRVSSALCRP